MNQLLALIDDTFLIYGCVVPDDSVDRRLAGMFEVCTRPDVKRVMAQKGRSEDKPLALMIAEGVGYFINDE